MLSAADRWFGRNIMHPPIIRLCQATGMTQFAVARYGWMLAAWTLVMRISFEGVGDWIFSLIIILLTVVETWRAAVTPDRPPYRSDILRRLLLVLTIVDIVLLAVRTSRYGFPGLGWSHAWDLFALIAEYAKTIRTIPPPRGAEHAERSVPGAPGVVQRVSEPQVTAERTCANVVATMGNGERGDHSRAHLWCRADYGGEWEPQ